MPSSGSQLVVEFPILPSEMAVVVDREEARGAKVCPDEGARSTNGHEVHISPEELEVMNFRMLSSSEKPRGKGFIIPRELPFELLRIRVIFTRLREQSRFSNNSLCSDLEDKVPVEAFQRAFERLFFLLSDPLGFNAKDYDENGDGYVSWGEFFHVYKRRNIKIKLSIFERIFLTFDDPETSHLSQIVSVVVLVTILVSSCCFILGTLPECQQNRFLLDPPLSEPKPDPVFEFIEYICLVLFTFEYVARLLTVWDVRSEIFDEDKILNLVIGFEPLHHSAPAVRLIRFIVAPSNLIDLAAILPALLSVFSNEDGGGFVVLRLIRLTRIFRVFKNPALAEPVIVISQTISQSTKALYVLVFNLLLGIVIFGSLMYLAEGQGEWNIDLQAYERVVGQKWNNSEGRFEDVKQPSPFLSIPHTFWWAIVTATTVGYGDVFPTTSLGKIVGVLTMVFSLVVLALPVGVIGGTFSQVWDDYKTQRKNTAEMRQQEMVYITSAIQRLDPTRMSRLMLIEVWNDYLGQEGLYGRPSPERFMGEVTLKLELPTTSPCTKLETLRLEPNMDLVKRTVSGDVTVKYEWEPRMDAKSSPECSDAELSTANFELHGKLTVTVVSADHLINLDFTHSNGASSPYCMVLCYPSSPDGSGLRPCVWRTPTIHSNLNPRFEASHDFAFAWSKPQLCLEGGPVTSSRSSISRLYGSPEVANAPADMPPGGSGAPGAGTLTKLDEVLAMVRAIGNELVQVRQEVRGLHGRIDRLAAPTAGPVPHGEQPNGNCSRPLALSGSPGASPTGQITHGEPSVLLPNWVPPPE